MAESEEIGSRRLKRVVGDVTNDVTVRILQPVEISEGAFRGNYACRYEIEGLPEPVSQDAIGVDSMQALLGSMRLVYDSLRPFQKELTQYGDKADGEIGLPFMTHERDLSSLRRLESAAEREMFAMSDEKAAARREKR
jgi:hypothetical protein